MDNSIGKGRRNEREKLGVDRLMDGRQAGRQVGGRMLKRGLRDDAE
ncbi:hypothetical protein [Paenibacillus etheri]|nr:hypothetical protein [Paenibacillus etheri]